MTAVHAQQLVEGYLGRLELELLDLPSPRRKEIVDEIRDHIAEERGGLKDESDADLMNLLDRLGDPAEIAAMARDGSPKPAPQSARAGAVEILALILTPIIWPAGVVLLWASSAWTTRQKLLGTLVIPGGIPLVFFVVPPLLLQSVTVCGGGANNNGVVVENTCTGPDVWQYILGTGLLVLSVAALVAPVVVGIYLATRLRVRPATA